MKRESYKLIKIVQNDEFNKAKSLLVPPRKKGSLGSLGSLIQLKKGESKDPDKDRVLDIYIREKLSHVDINCKDEENGYTSMMWAVLNGNKELVSMLIHFSADVNAVDNKGNTALHLASFNGRPDLVELLIKRSANVDAVNQDGNTALHIACQNNAYGNKYVLVKLLMGNPNVLLKNKDGATALDLAAQYARLEAVSLLLDHEPELRKSSRAFIQASIRGHNDIVKIMLDYGIDPNITVEGGTTALHEACRYLRYETAKLLLSYGADPDVKDLNDDTPKTLLAAYSSDKVDSFLNLFKQMEDEIKIVPKYLGVTTNDKCSTLDSNESLDSEADAEVANIFSRAAYPLISNSKQWTSNDKSYTNGCIGENINSNLLDDDPTTAWECSGSKDCWVSFDLHKPYILTGIKIWGRDSDKMPRNCEFQKADCLGGPWESVMRIKCAKKGPSCSKLPAEFQEIHGFKARSQFWRFYILNNYGDEVTSFSGLNFYGIEAEVYDFFKSMRLDSYITLFSDKGINTMDKLMNVNRYQISELIKFSEDQELLWESVKELRAQFYPLTRLEWIVPPVDKAFVDVPMPDFSIHTNEGVMDDVELTVEGAGVEGNNIVTLICPDSQKPSFAVFSDVTMLQEGEYTITVRSLRRPDKYASHCVTVVPKPKPEKPDLDAAFAELEKLLMF